MTTAPDHPEDALTLIYSTIDSLDHARTISRTLLEEGLIACANLIPGMTSLYHWRGKIEESPEVILLLKTRATLAETVITRTRQLHPYDTPAIFSIPVRHCHPAYEDWINASTGL